MTAEVPAGAVPGTRGPDTVYMNAGHVNAGHADARRKRDGSRSSLVWDILADVIAARAAQSGRTALDIVDVGAGTGGFAVSIASRGHRVTVVDPSPDALAAARWRAAEAGVTLTEVQGEAVDLPALVGEPGTAGADADAGADLVICHNVLEYVDAPDAALAAVLQRALAGRYAEALGLLPGPGSAGTVSSSTGSSSTAGPVPPVAASAGKAPSVTRRFTLPELTALIEGAGLRVGDAHGIRIFSSLLPGAGADPAAAEALRELEDAAATCPPLRDIAARLHVLGYRSF